MLRPHAGAPLGRTTGPRLGEPQQPRISTRRRRILAASASSYALRLTEPRSAALVVRSRGAPHGVHPLMNDQERSELELLKQRQARLEQELSLLSSQLKLLDERLNLPQAGQAQAAPATPPLIRMPPPPI